MLDQHGISSTPVTGAKDDIGIASIKQSSQQRLVPHRLVDAAHLSVACVPGDALRCFWNPAVQPSLWLPSPSTGEARHFSLDPLIRRDGQRWVVVPRGETTCSDQAMQGSSSVSFEVSAAQLHNFFAPKGCCHNLRLVSLRSAAPSQICHNLASEQ